MLFLQEARATIARARGVAKIEPMLQQLEVALKTLEKVTAQLAGSAVTRGAEVFLADATLYLEMFGIVAIAWQWLKQATVAQKALDSKAKAADTNFYQGKLVTANYFFAYELPKINYLVQRLTDGNPLTVKMESSYFND
jgi:butyryl-CoA dehydrogenase